MPDLDLNAIKARDALAAPGPWYADRGLGSFEHRIHGQDGSRVMSAEDVDPESAALNADFLAHARTDVPALVAEVERLRGYLDDHGYLATQRENARLTAALGAVAALADEWEAATDDGEWQDRLRAALAPVSGAVEVEHVLRPDHAEVMADLTARAHAAKSPGQAFYLAALAVHYARGETFPVDSAYAGIVRARRIVEDISGVGIKDHAVYGPDAVAKPDDSHDLSAARKSLIEAVARRLCRLDGVWDENEILPPSYGQNIPAWDEYTGRAYEVLDEVDESQWLAGRVSADVPPVAKHEQEVRADEREKIAQAIEAKARSWTHGYEEQVFVDAAIIARQGGLS